MTSSYYEKIGDNVNCIDEVIPFDIPDTWEWMRLKNCCSKEIRRGKSPKYADESGTLVFAQKCNTKYNGIDVGLALYLDETTLSRYPADEYMQDGDVVVNSTGTGTLGRVGFYQTADNRLELPIVPDSHVTVVRGSSNIQEKNTPCRSVIQKPICSKAGKICLTRSCCKNSKSFLLASF